MGDQYLGSRLRSSFHDSHMKPPALGDFCTRLRSHISPFQPLMQRAMDRLADVCEAQDSDFLVVS